MAQHHHGHERTLGGVPLSVLRRSQTGYVDPTHVGFGDKTLSPSTVFMAMFVIFVVSLAVYIPLRRG